MTSFQSQVFLLPSSGLKKCHLLDYFISLCSSHLRFCRNITHRIRMLAQTQEDQHTFSIFLLAEFLPHSRRRCSLMLWSSLPKWIILSMAAWLPPHSCLLDWADSTSAEPNNRRKFTEQVAHTWRRATTATILTDLSN